MKNQKYYERPEIEFTFFQVKDCIMFSNTATENSESMTEIDNEATADWGDW